MNDSDLVRSNDEIYTEQFAKELKEKLCLENGWANAQDSFQIIVSNLGRLSICQPVPFERVLSQRHWQELFEVAPIDRIKPFVILRTELLKESIFLYAIAIGLLDASLARRDLSSVVLDVWVKVIGFMPNILPSEAVVGHEMASYIWRHLSAYGILDNIRDDERRNIITRFASWVAGIENSSLLSKSTLYSSILVDILDEKLASRFISSLGESMLACISKQADDAKKLYAPYEFLFDAFTWHRPFVDKLVKVFPAGVAAMLEHAWPLSDDWTSRIDLILRFIHPYKRLLIEFLILPFSYEIGARFASCDSYKLQPDSFSDIMSGLGDEISQDALKEWLETSRLWLILHRIVNFRSQGYSARQELESQIRDLQAQAYKLATQYPGVWARSLPWLLARQRKLDGLVEAITVAVVGNSAEVESALLHAINYSSSANVRERAGAILGIYNGSNDNIGSILNDIVGFAAQYIDGRPVFPHPLSPMSGTWIGSLDVEKLLQCKIQSATRRFEGIVLDQGRIDEEHLTSRLVSSLEHALEEVEFATKALGKPGSKNYPVGTIKVKQRPVCKSEEKVYGCDLAIHLHADISGCINLEVAELIQVKKTLRLHNTKNIPLVDTWNIDNNQLNDILLYSQTATYWLIGENGEVLCVPGRLLLAIIKGSRKENQGTSRVSYHQIRSMALPIEQYLVNLFIGSWVGTSSSEALRVALGEVPGMVPRHVVSMIVETTLFGKDQ